MRLNLFFKYCLFLCILFFLSPSIYSISNIVSVEENFIRISSPFYATCQGAICSYEFIIENLDIVNRKVDITNLFNDSIEILNFYRWSEIDSTRQINTPYICNWYLDIVNGTQINITESCDNITTEDYTYYGWEEIPSIKYSDELKSSVSQSILIHKQKENTFKVEVFQPLGKITKFDIITDNWDESQTILDPWVDTNNYYINLTDYRYLASQSILYLSADNISYETDFVNTNVFLLSGGVINNLYEFNTTSSYLTITDNNTFDLGLSDFVISSRVKLDSVSNKYIVHKQSISSTTYDSKGWGLRITGANVFACDLDDGVDRFNMAGTTVLQSDTWYNVVCIIDRDNSANSYLYLNGIDDTDSRTGVITDVGDISTTNDVKVGVHYSGSLVSLDGQIDELLILNDISIFDLDSNYNISVSKIINNLKLDKENLSISSNYSGVEINYNENIIFQLNDSSLGNNLVSSQCYDLLTTELNWSIGVNLNYSLDLSNIVNYTFKECPVVSVSSTGGGLSFDLETESKFESYSYYINGFFIDYDISHIDNIFLKTEYELSLLFQSPTKVTSTEIFTFDSNPKKVLQEASDQLIENPTGTRLFVFIKALMNYLLSDNSIQVVNSGDIS